MVKKSNHLQCPLMQAGALSGFFHFWGSTKKCVGNKCAWWDTSNCSCVVISLVNELRDLVRVQAAE